jgi:23S rRNA pseudouridine1911/1915/1917 synthase
MEMKPSFPRKSIVFLIIKILETHTVPEGIQGVRLSDYAGGIFTSIPSRKGMKKAIKRAAVQVDGEVATTGTFIETGQEIQLLDVTTTVHKPLELKLRIHFEDDYLAVIEKPHGIVVSGNRHYTIENALRYNLAPSMAEDALPAPRPVHRLDQATHGLLIVAKSYKTMIALGKAFENTKIKKRYQAITCGEKLTQGIVQTPVADKEALTEYEVIDGVSSELFNHLSLVDLMPSTGRKHQLRVHLSSIGSPVLGDEIYCPENLLLKGKGMFLSAVQLGFEHPETGQIMDVEIEPSAKFKGVLYNAKRVVGDG